MRLAGTFEMVEADSRLAELSERYRASLPVKRASIERAWQALSGHANDKAKRDNLQRIVHRIAGSAPSYGYPVIGALASEAAAQLDRLRSVDPAMGPSTNDLSGLAALVDRLLDALAAGDRTPGSALLRH